MPTSTRACICPPAEAAAPVRAAHRSTAPRRRRRRPCRGGAPPPAPGPRRRRLGGPSCASPARARARARAAARRAHAGIVFSKHKSNQSVPLKRLATSGQFETRSEQGTHAGGAAPGAHATDSPKIARRSSAKAQTAFFDERRSYVTVRQVPPNFSQYLSKKSCRCSFCSACFVAHAYAFDGSM